MKDFQEVIDSQDRPSPSLPLSEVAEVTLVNQLKNDLLPYLSPFLLSIVTAPFNTASILLQTTSKGINLSSLDTKIKAQPNLKAHIMNGIFGDNKIYQAPTLHKYR